MKHFKISNFRFIAITLLLSMFLASCEEDPIDPTGNYTYTISSENSYMVSFVASGLDAESVMWDFGDGATSTSLKPVHTYETGGAYTVTLKIFGADGSTPAVITKTIMVIVSPTTDFTYEATYLTVTFTNTSSDAVSYAWDFGDGETSSDENPVHSYAETGDYTVSLTATGVEGSVPETFSETVSVAEGVIDVTNADFELSGSGERYSNWADVLGWNSDLSTVDSGVEYGDTWWCGGNTSYKGVLYSGDSSGYNITDHTITEGEIYRLNLNGINIWNGPQISVSIVYLESSGARNVIGTQSFDVVSNEWTSIELIATATTESVGGKLGIEIQGVSGGGDGWTGFDDVQLFIR